MGNFSRDPKARISDSIAKHYVSVLLQQGVPIIDADCVEQENLRRHQHEMLGKRFIGSGVPAGDDGFRIIAVAGDNDFAIKRGILLLNGKLVANDADTSYSTQPNAALTTPLTTPNADTTLIVYLETWEREVDSQEDTDLVDARIGIETCIRLKREWVVRAIAGANPQSLPVPPQDHDIYALCLIRRPANNAKITFPMMRELRQLHLTLAENIKSPLELYGATGNLVFTLQNFAEMLDTTAKAYFDILRSDLFMMQNFATATPVEVATLSAVFNEVTQSAQAASLQAKIRNLSNEDGLRVLQGLYEAQDHFVVVIATMTVGNSSRATASAFLLRLRGLLDGTIGVPGLKPAAFVTLDLDAAIRAQQEINREMGNRTQILPHGRIEIKFASGPIAEKITAGMTIRYQFNVTYVRTIAGPAQEEIFDVIPSLNPPGWTAILVGNKQNRITLRTEETVAVPIDVTIPVGTPVTSSNLKLQVRSRLNPTEMDTTSAEVTTTVGGAAEKPNPLQITLTSPAMNLDKDVLQVGRGAPIGLPGRTKTIKLRFANEEASALPGPTDFKVTFAFAPPKTFELGADQIVKFGGAEGAVKDMGVNLVATTTAVDGTLGSLTVSLVSASDPKLAAKPLIINLEVQKSTIVVSPNT